MHERLSLGARRDTRKLLAKKAAGEAGSRETADRAIRLLEAGVETENLLKLASFVLEPATLSLRGG